MPTQTNLLWAFCYLTVHLRNVSKLPFWLGVLQSVMTSFHAISLANTSNSSHTYGQRLKNKQHCCTYINVYIYSTTTPHRTLPYPILSPAIPVVYRRTRNLRVSFTHTIDIISSHQTLLHVMYNPHTHRL